MTISVSTLPAYVAAGEPCTLVGTCSDGADEDAEFSLSAVPQKSALALGKIVERHPTTVRTLSAKLTFHAATVKPERAANITRTDGSFTAEGFLPGMSVDISGTSSNNRRVTLAAVESQKLTLAPRDVLIAETSTASLLGAAYGSGGAATNRITFDVPGEYTVDAYEVFRVDAIGAHANDPLAVAQAQILSSTSATVHVGGYVEMPIQPVNGHGITLRLLVVNDTVRGAALVSPATDLARAAALDATVIAAVAALEGVAVTALDVDFVSDVNTLCAAYEAHRILSAGSPGVHYGPDNTNALLREPAYSLLSAMARLNDLAEKLGNHMAALSSGGTWHATDDTKNTLQVAPRATTLGEATVLKADLRERVYRRHRITTAAPASHGNADNINFMAPPQKLPAAIVAYLDFIASESPSVASGESEGIADAVAAWGFRGV